MSRPTAPRRLAAALAHWRVWLLNAALAATAFHLLEPLLHEPAPDTGVTIPWWVLVASFAAAERTVVHVYVRSSSHTMSLGEIPLVLGLLFCPPVHVASAWVVGLCVVHAFARMAPVRLAFNLVNIAVVGGLAELVLRAVADPAADAGLRLWAGAGLAALATSVLSAFLIATAMTLSGDRPTVARVRGMVAMGVAVSLTNASLALAVGVVLAADAPSALLLVAPAAALIVAYRAYTEQQRRNHDLQFLYDAGRTLSGADDGAAGVTGMLSMALETFRAGFAEVCMFPAAGEADGKRISVGIDGRLDLLAPIPAGAIAQLRELAGHDRRLRTIVTEDVGGALGAHLRSAGVARAMLAGLSGEHRLAGTFLLADRLGAGDFDAADRRLFETLASHTGATLVQDDLEQRVVELRETSDRLFHQAFHDPLTGLANRLLFLDRVGHALARRTGNVAVLYLDLDDFKPVNDTLGHEAGDALLRAVGDRLRRTLRAADTAARLGGDEFAVILVDIPPDHVQVVIDRILHAFEGPVDLGGATATISASIGAALADSGTTSTEELVRRADAAMYLAKRGGKRRSAIHEPRVAA